MTNKTSANANARFVQAVEAWANEDFERAAREANHAFEQEPDHLVYGEAAAYLDRVLQKGRENVYVSPRGFRAFIRGGGNIHLYEATSAALKQVYESAGPLALLDIGVGDGLALLPALSENIRQIDLVEPSAELLAQTEAALEKRGVPHRAFNLTLQQFEAQPAGQSQGQGQWDIAQATFSFQSVPPAERLAALRWLRERTKRMLIVEFDAPSYVGAAQPEDFLSPQRIDYVVTHYQRGLAEYDNRADDDSSVAQGFLMPVFFGYFDRSANRTNWEIPTQGWADLLREAGFAQLDIRPIFDYWWAPARLIGAR